MALLPERGDPGITFIGFLILAALGTFFWKAVPLETARPRVEQPQTEAVPSARIEARLWQDPLEAVSKQLGRPGTGEVSADASAPLGEEVAAALAEADGDVVIMPVMVYGGSHAELQERRRRRRYAVLSGLAEFGFAPRDPEHLEAFCVDLAAPGAGSDPAAGCDARAPMSCRGDGLRVPYEWLDLDRSGSPPGEAHAGGLAAKAVVLWVDESRLEGAPFQRLRRLLGAFLTGHGEGGKPRLRVAILGPARSGTLRRMVEQQGSFKTAFAGLLRAPGVAGIQILSAAATVADDDLTVVVRGDTGRPAAGRLATFDGLLDQFAAPSEGEPAAAGLGFLRTIRTDDELMKLLVRELLQRQFDCGGDYLVVLSEWDTHFGRRLPKAFEETFRNRCGPGSAERVRLYTYQRGIDGAVPGKAQAKTDSGRQAGPGEDADWPLGRKARVRPPVGTGQFDYLRRLAADIRARDRSLRLDSGHGIRAVAVLGSDVYDKLLILRALRPLLPEAIWLTTDLDAHLLHPQEFKWARNLVVASSFGLRLGMAAREASRPEPENRGPPFRDSYQTAFFLAAGMAVNPQHAGWHSIDAAGSPRRRQEAFDEKIPPLLFEIGRGTLVPLHDEESGAAAGGRSRPPALNGDPPESFAVPTALALLAIAVLGIVAVNQMLPRSGALVSALAVGLVLVGGLTVVVLGFDQGGEPLSLSAGVSVWPTEYIRVGTLLLAVSFTVLAAQRLNRNWALLGYRYFGDPAEEPPQRLTLRELLGQVRRFSPRPRPWLWLALGLGVLVMLIMGALPRIPFGLTGRLAVLLVLWALVIALWLEMVYGRLWVGVRLRSINQWAVHEPTASLAALSREYEQHGELEHRVLRTLSNLLFYVAFASLLFVLLGIPSAPCRGELACTVDRVLIALCVLAMLFLLFFVVDATRLCIIWIDLLRRRGLDWAEADEKACTARYGLPPKHCLAWTLVHMIGERTSEVARLIYYPVLVILLLLLSRSTFFDAWGLPQALAVVVGINIAIALSAAVRLNQVARAAREDILDELRREQLTMEAEEGGGVQRPTPREVQGLVDQLAKLRTGAFENIWDRPVVRAFLLLLGAIGITFSEYFALM